MDTAGAGSLSRILRLSQDPVTTVAGSLELHFTLTKKSDTAVVGSLLRYFTSTAVPGYCGMYLVSGVLGLPQ